MLEHWVRVARTRKAFHLERVLQVLEENVKTGKVTIEEIEKEHAIWVAALRVQNRIHAFRD